MAKHRYAFPQTVTSLAYQVGVDRAHLSMVLSSRSGASVALAKRIEAATGGVIRWTDFFEDGPPHQDSLDDLGTVGVA